MVIGFGGLMAGRERWWQASFGTIGKQLFGYLLVVGFEDVGLLLETNE